MSIAFAFILFIALLGLPIFAVIIALSSLGFYSEEVNPAVVFVNMARVADVPFLIAFPLFTFAGYLLSYSHSSERLLGLVQALIGSIPSGLPIVVLFICVAFTALTGASGVTIVALGALLFPALKKAGYQERYSLGLVTTSGSLGILLAPSLPLILYGIVAQKLEVGESFSMLDLFLAAIPPLILTLSSLVVWNVWVNRNSYIQTVPFSYEKLLINLRGCAWELPLPFLIIAGIYSGYFVISEVALLVVLYLFVVEVLIYKEISWDKFKELTRESMVVASGILLIISASLAFTDYLVEAGIPDRMVTFMNTMISNKYAFLLLLNIFLLMLGALLDIYSAIIIVVPLLLPVAVSYGVHPVHFGIIFLANMQIGYSTPPVGMDLFVSSYRFRIPIEQVYRACLPIIGVLLLNLMLITYLPGISLLFIE